MSARSKNGGGRGPPHHRPRHRLRASSTTSQDLTPQTPQLKAAGCTRIYARRFPALEATGRSG